LERILTATANLLRQRPLSEITVAQITTKAKCCTASFYQRFPAKEDLVPALYEQYDRHLRSRVETMLAKAPSSNASFRETVRRLIGLMVDQYANERWLYREFVLYARTHSEVRTPELVARRKEVHRLPLAILSRFKQEIRHADPEKAILFAIFLVSAAAREKILFEAPHAVTTNISFEDLKTELTRAFIAYLTSGG
jgi:AcrR family transcriptional regulator